MAILHKLILALRRLDPHNHRWQHLQQERARAKADAAFDTKDPRERKAELNEISDTFEQYSGDFGRKLYLIQNSIFGVDIQPIATQIAKLRFFISPAIEQQPNPNPQDNFGIQPLPNLETRFIAADTLLPLHSKIDQLPTNDIHDLRRELASNREQHFHAANPHKKLEYRTKDKELREKLAAALRAADFSSEAARKIAHWNPYDQNAQAPWFQPPLHVRHPPRLPHPHQQPPLHPTPKKPRPTSWLKAQYGKSTRRYFAEQHTPLQLVRDGGMHVFVCSNSWLDVGYGAKLQEHLLKNAHIQAIYESAVERQFSTADINTIISVIRKTTANDNNVTRFVQLRNKFELAVRTGGERREIAKSRAELVAAATNPQNKKFIGDKWGGKYLRGLDIYHHILDKCADKLVRLGNVADVFLGIITGANEFFYLTQDQVDLWTVEPEYLRPVIKSSRESRSLIVNHSTLANQIFMCHRNKAELAGTGALAYIEWGEARGYNNRPTFRSHPRWIDTTARTFFTESTLLWSDNFQQIRSKKVSPLRLCVSMNTTLSQLMFNIGGRANFGGGLLKIQAYETQNQAIVNPSLLPLLDAALFASSDWDVLTPSPERRQIDDAVFDALELTAGEREAVYEGVTKLVTNRKRRASSV